MNEIIDSLQELKVSNRNIIQLSGIKKVVSFNDKEFILETTKGPIHIYGENLELGTLDSNNGNIIINGKFNGFDYLDKNHKKNDESIWTKLFKWIVFIN